MTLLILTRRPNESIMVGHDIEITVLGVKGQYVRLGLKAPKGVPIHREEIYQAILRENTARTEALVSDS